MSFRKGHGCIFNQILQITLEEKLGDVIKDISIDASNMNWLMDALKESHHEEKRYHESAITRMAKKPHPALRYLKSSSIAMGMNL